MRSFWAVVALAAARGEIVIWLVGLAALAFWALIVVPGHRDRRP